LRGAGALCALLLGKAAGGGKVDAGGKVGDGKDGGAGKADHGGGKDGKKHVICRRPR